MGIGESALQACFGLSRHDEYQHPHCDTTFIVKREMVPCADAVAG